jgi:uncharacterized protein
VTPMTLMRIREITSCDVHARTIIVLEDAGQRLTLRFYADPEETRRLAQALRHGRCACHPVYDFIDGLLQAFRATPTRVVLDDVEGRGIGGLLYARHADSEVGIPCYPPDALALALRAELPIYATPRALEHAEPASRASAAEGGDVRHWLERVKPEDFSRRAEGGGV